MAKVNPYSADQNPDLALADYPNVASGSPRQFMPVYPGDKSIPPLSSDNPGEDMMMLGIDPTIDFCPLNLANADCPIPTPEVLAGPVPMITNGPTFYTPDFSVKPLQDGVDLVDGIDHFPPFQVDPLTPDLSHYIQPKGLAPIVAASSDPMAIDPNVPDLRYYDHPNNLQMPGPLTVDPDLPDLNTAPQLEPDVMMPDRPADLAPDALSVMKAGATFAQLDDVDYSGSFMDQSGMNTTRRRRQLLLQRGLDGGDL